MRTVLVPEAQQPTEMSAAESRSPHQCAFHALEGHVVELRVRAPRAGELGFEGQVTVESVVDTQAKAAERCRVDGLAAESVAQPDEAGLCEGLERYPALGFAVAALGAWRTSKYA